jgi:aspartate/methionine/tyrosine aminotransferase
MDVAEFELERWLAEYEHDAAVNLGDSGVQPLAASRFDTDPGDLGYVIPTQGDPDLRETVAARYGRGPGEVAFTCGTQEANLVTMLSLVDRDDHVVVVTPTYQSLHALPETVGEVTRVELSPPDWTLDTDDVAAAISSDTALVVLNNPNNPLGVYHDRDTVEAVYDLAADAGAYLLCDEVYRLLADDPLPPVASIGPRGISTAGLSKAWGLPGLRFGWVAGPERVVAGACQWKDYTTIAPPAIGQHVARQALARESELLSENRAHARRNRDLVASFVDEYDLDWHRPTGVTAFISIPDNYEAARPFCRRLVEEGGVVVVPGETFGYPEYVRLGFGAETETLQDGLGRIGAFIDG